MGRLLLRFEIERLEIWRLFNIVGSSISKLNFMSKIIGDILFKYLTYYLKRETDICKSFKRSQ